MRAGSAAEERYRLLYTHCAPLSRWEIADLAKNDPFKNPINATIQYATKKTCRPIHFSAPLLWPWPTL